MEVRDGGDYAGFVWMSVRVGEPDNGSRHDDVIAACWWLVVGHEVLLTGGKDDLLLHRIRH